MTPLPAALLDADAAYHAYLESVVFSTFINPLNMREAVAAFRAGAEAPPFAYQPLTDAPALLARLDAISPPLDHPFGQLLARAVQESRRFVEALQHRDAEHFDRLNEACGWYSDPDDFGPVPDIDAPEELPLVSPAQMAQTLEAALAARGMDDWVVQSDPVMASRLMVDAARRVVKVNPAARFRTSDLRGMVAHEIDVHVARSAAGQRQPLRIFRTGLPGCLQTEEGLALAAEERVGALPPGTLIRQRFLAAAVERSRVAGFRETYQWLLPKLGPGPALSILVRIKRGLADPASPGVYARDTCYLRGWRRVRRYLDAGGDVRWLYVGKVGLQHPIQAWVEEGWLEEQPVPALWREERREAEDGRYL